MLTMDQILRNTPENRIVKASSDVSMDLRKLGVNKKTGVPMVAASVWSDDLIRGKKKRVKYATSVGFFKKGKVKVSCSCPDFMYRCEYLLAQKGSAEIKYGNGDAPTVANAFPGACKHLIFLYNQLSRKEITALVNRATS